MALIKFDLEKMYLHTKTEVLFEGLQKVIDIQTDRLDWKHHLPLYAGGKNL